MHDLSKLEQFYKKYINDIGTYLPEDIIVVNLELLHKMNLLNYYNSDYNDGSMTRYFYVTESTEKITLMNDHFLVWIVPDKADDEAITYTLIALNEGDQDPRLELCYVASGVYNNSKLVLRLLEKFLGEIEENESTIKKIS